MHFQASIPDRVAALVGTAVFPAVSWLAATGYVAVQDWFGASDLSSFAVWSIIGSFPVYPALRLYDRHSQAWGATMAFGAATISGLATGVLWTTAVTLILGGWIGAFSFPVFLCWLSGALCGFVACALVRRPRTWPIALTALAIPFLAVITLLRTVFVQPSDLLVHVAPGTTAQQLEIVWTELLGRPSPTGVGHTLIEGVRTIARYDGNGETRIRVRFAQGTSEARREQIVAHIRASPFVAQTSDFENAVSDRTLPDAHE